MLKEYIICAAIDHNGTIICGLRHDDCYKILFSLTNSSENPPGNDKQGFLTSWNRFIDRKEAYKIAKENNQIRWGKNEERILISENLY